MRKSVRTSVKVAIKTAKKAENVSDITKQVVKTTKFKVYNTLGFLQFYLSLQLNVVLFQRLMMGAVKITTPRLLPMELMTSLSFENLMEVLCQLLGWHRLVN